MKGLLRRLAIMLMSLLMCVSVMHLQVRADDPLPTDGTAYGVLLGTGELLLIRSFEEHYDKYNGSITDIYGNPYEGTIYCYVENGYYEWANEEDSQVKSFRIAEDFIVKPLALDNMFFSQTHLETVSLERLDTSLATEMDNMFYSCTSLKSITFPAGFDTSNVTTFDSMFSQCHCLKTVDISSFDFSKVESMAYMFDSCWVLEEIKWPEPIDTSNVKCYSNMFYDCYGLKELDLSSFNTRKAETMSYMFGYCENLKKLDISSFDTGNTTNVDYMLENLDNLEEIKLGSKFTNWHNIDLVQGKWKKGDLLKTTDELTAEYPTNAASLAGTWTRVFDTIERLELTGYEPLIPGESSVIHYWTEPGFNVHEEFEWSSSDESVATVDNLGTVYAHKVGETVITAKTTDGSNLESSIKVVVKDDIAYGILSDEGEMVLIRSNKRLEVSLYDKVTVKDINDVSYTGYVYGSIEGPEMPDWFRWNDEVGTFIVKIKKFRIAEGTTIAPQNIDWWLSAATNLEEVDFTGINTTENTSFSGLFFNDTSLKKINFGTMDTSSAEGMYEMFKDCAVLEEITFGENFTKYLSGTDLPVGIWSNGSQSYTAEEFEEKFSKDTTGLAGTWTRKVVKATSFNVIEDEIKVEAGTGGEFTYEYTPDDATIDIEWTSSDPDKLTVWSSGSFWAYEVGEYTVTAHTLEGSDLYDTVKIIVTEPVKATSFMILEDEMTVEVGNNGIIPFEYEPEEAHVEIEWISSDPDGLYVWSDGYFETYKTGTYTITAHTTDGSDLNDTVKIIVVEKGTLPYDPWLARMYGSNRYKTGFAIAREICSVWPEGKCDYFIVACGNNFADALAGSYLAAKKNAPILLVNDDKAQEVSDFIKKKISDKGVIYILGGTAAVSSKAETILKKAGTVKRLRGSNRYDTNLKIIKEAGMDTDTILVATGLNYADSLSASATGYPILLVKDSLNGDQKDFLNKNKGKKIYVIGGKNAVSAGVESELKKYGDVKRLAGDNRVYTSVKIAEEFFKDPAFGVVAFSHDFADGLCGGPFAYMAGAPLLLTREENMDITQQYISKQYHINGVCLGGTARITDKVFRKLFGAKSSVKINELEWK